MKLGEYLYSFINNKIKLFKGFFKWLKTKNMAVYSYYVTTDKNLIEKKDKYGDNLVLWGGLLCTKHVDSK